MKKLLLFIWIVYFIPVNSQENHFNYLNELKEQLGLKWPHNRTVNIVFHGHSVPSGYFTRGVVKTFQAYPHLFHKYLKSNYPYAVINCITTSIGGENSEQGVKRFKRDVLILKPDLLFIDYGLNDRGISLKRAEKSWRKMIKMAIKEDIKIVLMTPTPDLNENILDENAPLVKYAEMIRELALQYNVPVIDSYKRFKTLKEKGINISKYMAQNNHPNEKGHKEVLQEIVLVLFGEKIENY